MPSDEQSTPAEREQIEQLAALVERARQQGIHTGVRNDELHDLDEREAAELIEQLQRRLGEARG